MVLFQHKSWPHLQGVDLHRLWGGLANTGGDGGGRRGPLLAEAVIVPSHRLSLLPMLSVTGHPYHKANTCWAPDDVVQSVKALNAMTISSPSDPRWYIDTRVTPTMTPLE